MLKNKKIMGIAVVALLAISLTGGTVAAYAANNTNQPNIQAVSIDTASANAELHNRLLVIAEKYGIDTSMTDKQIAEVINSRLRSGSARQITIDVRELATDLGIDVSGMGNQEISLAVKEKLNVLIGSGSTREELEELAAKYDINTADMTDEQILAALASYKESNASVSFGSPDKESKSNTNYGSPDKGGSVSRGTGSLEKESRANENYPVADKATAKNNSSQPNDSTYRVQGTGKSIQDEQNNSSSIVQRAGR